MATKKGKRIKIDGDREAFWRKAGRRWRKSGLSVAEFCGGEEFSEGTFYRWRRRFEKRKKTKTATRRPRFLAVDVIDERHANSRGDLPIDQNGGSGLELLLSNGMSLRIPQGFDETTLKRTLRALSGEPSSC